MKTKYGHIAQLVSAGILYIQGRGSSPSMPTLNYGVVAKLVDALDLEFSTEMRESSSLSYPRN